MENLEQEIQPEQGETEEHSEDADIIPEEPTPSEPILQQIIVENNEQINANQPKEFEENDTDFHRERKALIKMIEDYKLPDNIGDLHLGALRSDIQHVLTYLKLPLNP